MKTKNIVQTVTLAGLITTGSTKPMMVGAALKKAAQWSLQKAGTALGLGLPTYGFLKQTVQNLRDPYPTELPGLDTRSLDQEEATILQKYIGSNINIKIAKTNDINELGGLAYGNTIVLPKELTTKDGQMQVDQILKGSDTETKRAIIAITQHENGHHICNHNTKRMAAKGIIPPLITTVAALTFKRFLPYNCVGRFLTKTTGGLVLVDINSIVLSAIHRQNEFEADQHISSENREAFANSLKLLHEKNEKINKAKLLLQGHDHNTIKAIGKVALLFATHPSPEERIKRLQNNSTKTA